jgi:hypothetical protein
MSDKLPVCRVFRKDPIDQQSNLTELVQFKFALVISRQTEVYRTSKFIGHDRALLRMEQEYFERTLESFPPRHSSQSL